MHSAGLRLPLFNPLVFDLLFETGAMRCQVNFIDSTGDARFSCFSGPLRSFKAQPQSAAAMFTRLPAKRSSPFQNSARWITSGKCKKRRATYLLRGVLFGEPSGIRTPDTLIKSKLDALNGPCHHLILHRTT